MECPVCGSNRIQFRARNNKTLVTKYKCIACNQIFEIDEASNPSQTVIDHMSQIKKDKKEQEAKNENSNHRRFTSVI